MQALMRDAYGPPERLSLREVETPEPAPGEVRVRIRVAALNDWDGGLLEGDWLNRLMFGLLTPRVRILGADIAGTVDAVGSDVTLFKPGDRVHGDLSGCGFGGFAETVCVDPAHLVALPEGLSFEQGAALPHAGQLAWQALAAAGGLGPGRSVLINGAGGGVGTLLLQLARGLGAEVTAVDRASKLERLQALGADHALDHAQVDFTAQGRRYDVIFDVKTDRSPFAYLRTLHPGGAYVTVGGRLSRLVQILGVSPILRLATGKRLRLVALRQNRDLVILDRAVLEERLTPVVDQIRPLAEGPEALRRFAAAEHFGKILLEMP
ncbi:MAG TPA: NAD(P)-dependent alcohol dehydrogenase [Holophagaceae bacterium]|nr:NAD(P)-dependent alcohol dehydrogenase [Holophagaceae bacterium]